MNTYYSGDYEWELIDDPAADNIAQQSIDMGAEVVGTMPDGSFVTAKNGMVWKRGKRYKVQGRMLRDRIREHVG